MLQVVKTAQISFSGIFVFNYFYKFWSENRAPNLNVILFKSSLSSLPKMQLLHSTRQLLKKCDLFSTSQFLRYQGQSDYKTASGGICSLVVVAIFTGLFMNIAIQTANMEIINWSSTVESSFNPSSTSISIDPKNTQFMFGVNIVAIDLNEVGKRYFDIHIMQRTFNVGWQQPQKKVQMVPCTQQHFNINPQIASKYTELTAKYWLCPPLGYNFTLEGKWTSSSCKITQIYIGKCNNSTNPSRPCASDTELNDKMAIMGQFALSFVYANPIINPGNSDYLSYYLEDRNYIRFTPKLGTQSTGFVQDYSIVTDVSLMPYTQNVEDAGIIIPGLFQNLVYQVTDGTYASFLLQKASSTVTYQRSFNKVDSFFSYVGGLIGTILGIMLFMNTFTEMSFELDLSQRLFKYMDNDPSNFNSFNLLTYVRFLVYSLLSFFGMCQGWFEMVKYDACKEETTHQLDIELMLNKMNFLQRAVEVLFQEDQLYFLHLQKFDTLKKLKKRRRQYSTRQNLRKSKGIKGNEANQSESDDKSDESDKNSEKAKAAESNLSNYMINMKSVANSNVSIVMLDKIRERPVIDNHKGKGKENQVSTKQQLQRLRHEMEEGNTVSKRIFQGIDPIFLDSDIKFESFHKIDKEELGESKLELAEIRRNKEEILIPQKMGFQFIAD